MLTILRQPDARATEWRHFSKMFFREIRNFASLCYGFGYITAEEYAVLLEEYQSSNPEFPYDEYPAFDLNSMDEAECLAEFRFEKRHIPLLAEALRIPAYFTTPQRSRVNGLEGLCILLKRLSYPCRYSDMIQRFAYPVPVLSMVTNEVLNFLYETHGHRILQWNDLLLNPAALEDYAHAIFNKGAPLRNCFGFIDGTIRPICRPGENQRFVFNGHKRLHSLKFQSVAIPNGLIANMYGPVEGKKHDSGMLTDSGLMAELEGRAYSTDGQAMCLYGDPAYPLRVHLQAPYRGAQLTEQMKFFNKSMSATRVSVEWLFGDIVNYFKFVDFKRNLKIRLSSVGKMYLVCALLHNSHTCLYGNLTSEFFGVAPPTLQQYFG